MKNKLRKSFLILLSILTFGLISPSQFDQYVKADSPGKHDSFETTSSESSLVVSKVLSEESKYDRENNSNELVDKPEISYQNFDQSPKANSSSNHVSFETASSGSSLVASTAGMEESKFEREKYINELVDKAETRSYQKFGSKIKPVIQDEFREFILPNIEAAISQTAAKFPEQNLRRLSITEQPGGGNSEKIFNVKNLATGNDILKFHVRRDNPPQDGFWFNFHYHTIFDGFQIHHNLGSIYWSKDTPPKWMS